MLLGSAVQALPTGPVFLNSTELNERGGGCDRIGCFDGPNFSIIIEKDQDGGTISLSTGMIQEQPSHILNPLFTSRLLGINGEWDCYRTLAELE